MKISTKEITSTPEASDRKNNLSMLKKKKKKKKERGFLVPKRNSRKINLNHFFLSVASR